jgi:hypothetical protein
MGLISRILVFIVMSTEMQIKSKAYWENLSKDGRLELLQKYNFWCGFSQYWWQYLPEDLKRLISFKIDLNGKIDEKFTIIF